MFVVRVPGINGLGKTKGCEKAGNCILESVNEVHSSESKKPVDIRLWDLEEIHLDNFNVEYSNELIYKNSLEAFETKPRTFFLGGDHSISYSIGKAFLQFCRNQRREPCLIIFDAHADCMQPMKEPTHEEWLRALIESGFPAESILLVGMRNPWKDETEFVDKKKIKNISINQLNEDLQEICDVIMEFANGKELYVSVDIDIVDPAFAPGTGYAEPGGLTSRQLIYLIQRINKMKNLRAVDIVEINPDKDDKNMTVKLGAKILCEFV